MRHGNSSSDLPPTHCGFPCFHRSLLCRAGTNPKKKLRLAGPGCPCDYVLLQLEQCDLLNSGLLHLFPQGIALPIRKQLVSPLPPPLSWVISEGGWHSVSSSTPTQLPPGPTTCGQSDFPEDGSIVSLFSFPEFHQPVGGSQTYLFILASFLS